MKGRDSHRFRAMAAVLGILLVAHEAAAQQISDVANLTLEGLMRVSVTTASRTEETLANAPARVEVVTAEQIRRRGYRSLTDVLKDLVDFKVDLGADADYTANLTVQGVRGSNLVIVLLDGVRISSPTNEPLPILANYPVHTAQQIEILYGPASAMYGADAFAAVVNIITKKGPDATGVSAETAFGQDGLFNQRFSYGRGIGRGGNLLLAGQFLYDRQPDLSQAYPNDFQGLQGQTSGVFNTIFGPMTPRSPVSSEYEAPLSGRSMQAAVHAGGFSLSLFGSESKASTTPPYTPDNAVYTADAFNKNTLLAASAGYVRSAGRATSSTMVTVSRHELSPESGYFNVFSNLRRSYKYAYGSMVKGDQQVTWKANGRVTMSGGATVERFFAIPQTADLNEPIESQDARATILDTDIVEQFVKLHDTNTGAYGQVRYGVTPDVSVVLGARGDYNTRFGGTFNPRAGVVWRPADATTLKLLYGSAFLAPSPYEAYSHYGSFYSTDGGQTYMSDYWHLGNPNLRPQRKRTVEATLTQGLGTWLVLSASSFYSRMIDLRKTTDADQAYSGTYLGWPVSYIDFPVNEGNEIVYGGTIGLEATRVWGGGDRFNSKTVLSIADGRVSHDDVDGGSWLQVGSMAPIQLRSTVDLDLGAWSVAPRLAVVGRQRAVATELRGDTLVRRTIPGYTTLDLSVRRRLTRVLDAFVTVGNALDARYRHVNDRAFTNPEELVGAPQNPRRVAVGLSMRLE